MKRVFLCNDIWFDCLPFLSRAKVGFEFALVSDRFDRLADAHLGSKKRPWTLGILHLVSRRIDQNVDQCEAKIVVDHLYAENEELAFPEEPLPDNVIGFEYIYIKYVDHKVIAFLRRIRRLFQPTNNGNGIGLELNIHSSERSWAVFRDSILPLINSSAITKLVFRDYTFDIFRRRISPTFLLDWTNVRLLVAAFDVSFGNGENGQLLRQWLYAPREDGNPKLLRTYYDWNLQTVEQVKTEFLSAQNAVSFIIDICYYNPVPFELENLHTGERLAFRKVEYRNCWLLERGPIGGRDAEKWAKWEREAIGVEKDYSLKKDHNLLNFWLYDNAIGPLDDEIAGPSGQQLQQQK